MNQSNYKRRINNNDIEIMFVITQVTYLKCARNKEWIAINLHFLLFKKIFMLFPPRTSTLWFRFSPIRDLPSQEKKKGNEKLLVHSESAVD